MRRATFIWGVSLTCAALTGLSMDLMESDWLFQCDNKVSAETIGKEIGYTRDMITRTKGVDFAELLKKLEALEKQAPTRSSEEDLKALYVDVRRLKRNVMLKNPLLDFERILLIDNPYPLGKPGDATDEWGHEARHRNGFMAEEGGKLITVKVDSSKAYTAGDDGVVDLLPQQHGSYWRPDLGYDAKKIVFSYRPVGDKSFHLYECNADGTGFTQLTRGDYDDLDPAYLPDGKLVFCTGRQHSYVRCMPMTHSFAMARCDGDGKNIYILSANGEPEYQPSVMNDGRVLFTRWEYTDKALWRVQSLWYMDPDGCAVQAFWGNQSVWPDVLTEARAIPGSKKVLFTGLGHHAWFDGSIGMIDPEKGLNYPDGLYRITRDAQWPEVGNGPADPPPHVDYHAAGKFYAYKTPYPLSEELFLVSAREGGRLYSGKGEGREHTFRLYLMDVYGNKELIYKGTYNAYHAMPFKARVRPAIMADKVKWPKITEGTGVKQEPIAPATFYSNDVFENAPPILREKGKFLRVIQMDPKTYTTWNKTVQHDGPAISVFQADGVKRILGTIPIESDGSVNFEIPPGQSIFFQMLDAEGRAIHVMRSFANGMPGEHRGCFGCHETSMQTRTSQGAALARKGKALTKRAVKLTPPSWGAEESIGYKRFVQPVLDKHCARCHTKEDSRAMKAFNTTYRPSTHGWWASVYDRPEDISPFAEPYYTLVDGACGWGGAKAKNEKGVPKNLAGVFIVEGYSSMDPKNLETLPPYSAFSAVSRFIHMACSGEHKDVKVTGVDRERLIAWVDCNGPFLGDEEIRAMYDPWSPQIETGIMPVRPRIGTAPRINRFNLRQDGDTMALCGPLRLMPNRPERFDPNERVKKLRQEQIRSKIGDEKDIKVEIVSMFYGLADKSRGQDVTQKAIPTFAGTRLSTIQDYNSAFGDTVPSVVKVLLVEYKINGGEVKKIKFSENAEILLPK